MKYEVKDSADIKEDTLTPQKSPYHRMIEKVMEEGEYYTYPEVCDLLRLSRPTISHAAKGAGVPSKYVQWGKRHVWLWTPGDVEKIAEILKVGEIKWQ